MPKNGIGKRMACWWYLILVLINLIQAQNPFDGGGFLADPFLELTGGITTPPIQKTNKTDSACVSSGTLVGSIIATLLLSALVAFLTWMIYLRQKLQELQSYENRQRKHVRTSPQSRRVFHSLSNQNKIDSPDQKHTQLPLDVTDCKFGTYPFRQSQIQGSNGHYNPTDWLNRTPSSFRSVTTDQDTQTMDIELLNPTFCGLNFSITGNMRAGIFIKEILAKETAGTQMKLNSSDQLRTGDRIIALTVCFESIVYEDALTILSYASPYPVILRVQRPMHSTKINVETEKRPATATKVKWRDDFEHYDNDTPYNRSVVQVDSSKTLITELKSAPSPSHLRSSSKKPHSHKSSTTPKDATNNPEATPMPYYDSPYDYYSGQISQSHLNQNNNNNNNSSSTESLTAVTSVYTLQLSSTNSKPLTQRIVLPRRCERRLSSPAIIFPITISKTNENDISLENIDTCV